MHDDGIGLIEALQLLAQRWWLLLVVPLVAAGVVIYISIAVLQPVYLATTTLWVARDDSGPITYETLLLNRSLASTYAHVLQSRAVLTGALQSLGLSGLPLEELQKKLKVSTVRDTEILTVSIVDTSPTRAAELANGVADSFTARIRNQAQPDNVVVVDPAIAPDRPIRPKPVLNGVAAYALGLVVTSGAVLAKGLTNTSFHTGAELGQSLGLPVLGTIPALAGRRTRRRTGMLVTADPRANLVAVEAYRMLRTNVQFLGLDEPLRTLLITSALPEEGKSITAANLGAVFAQAGVRVCLVDADLRRPTLSRIFEQEAQPGLVDLLTGQAELEECLRQTNMLGVTLLPAGSPGPVEAELLNLGGMSRLLAELGQRFDLVLLDTPPVMAVADTLALAPHSDGILLVVKARSTSQSHAQAAQNSLMGVRGRILGVVLNRVKPSGVDAPYAYHHPRQLVRAGGR